MNPMESRPFRTRWALVAMAALISLPGIAVGWSLDNDASRLSFVTIKAGDVGEVHRFRSLSGSVGEDGAVSVQIDLSSVDTLIPIRDERMQEFLFNTARFPTATFTTNIDAADYAGLGVGEVAQTKLPGVLNLVGSTLELNLNVLVARLSPDRMLVTTREPALVNAASVGLVNGVEKLREIAGLPSISKAVPVSVILMFVAD